MEIKKVYFMSICWISSDLLKHLNKKLSDKNFAEWRFKAKTTKETDQIKEHGQIGRRKSMGYWILFVAVEEQG